MFTFPSTKLETFSPVYPSGHFLSLNLAETLPDWNASRYHQRTLQTQSEAAGERCCAGSAGKNALTTETLVESYSGEPTVARPFSITPTSLLSGEDPAFFLCAYGAGRRSESSTSYDPLARQRDMSERYRRVASLLSDSFTLVSFSAWLRGIPALLIVTTRKPAEY